MFPSAVLSWNHAILNACGEAHFSISKPVERPNSLFKTSQFAFIYLDQLLGGNFEKLQDGISTFPPHPP
jgi:hypothetical protein